MDWKGFFKGCWSWPKRVLIKISPTKAFSHFGVVSFWTSTMAHRLGFIRAVRHPWVRRYQRTSQSEEQIQELNLKLEISEQWLPTTTFDEVITREPQRDWTLGTQSRSAGSNYAAKTKASGWTPTQSGSLVAATTSLQMLKDFCPTVLTRSPKVLWQQHTLPVTNTTHGGEVICSHTGKQSEPCEGQTSKAAENKTLASQTNLPDNTHWKRLVSVAHPFAGPRQDCLHYAEIQ